MTPDLREISGVGGHVLVIIGVLRKKKNRHRLSWEVTNLDPKTVINGDVHRRFDIDFRRLLHVVGRNMHLVRIELPVGVFLSAVESSVAADAL